MEGWRKGKKVELDAALHHASRLLLKHIDRVLILHFQLQEQTERTSSVKSAWSLTRQLLIITLRLRPLAPHNSTDPEVSSFHTAAICC